MPKWKAEVKLIMIMSNYDDDYDKDDVIHVRRNVERIHGIRTSLSFYKKKGKQKQAETQGAKLLALLRNIISLSGSPFWSKLHITFE